MLKESINIQGIINRQSTKKEEDKSYSVLIWEWALSASNPNIKEAMKKYPQLGN